MVCPPKIWPVELVRRWRIIRASFSQERMTYVTAQDSSDGVAKVIYQSKDAKTTKIFDALDWPALLNRVPFREIYQGEPRLVTHVPNKGEQPVESLKVE